MTCGTIGRMIRKVQRFAREYDLTLEIINTKFDTEALKEQAKLLRKLNIRGSYEPVIVIDDEAKELRTWNI